MATELTHCTCIRRMGKEMKISKKLTQKIQERFFAKSIFLFDLDGTLYLGEQVLEGALTLVEKLRALRKQIFFFTNNSSRSEKDYYEKLSKMGFNPRENEVVMSTHSLVLFLQKKKMKSIYLVGTPAMKEMLEATGFKHHEQEPEAVVVGFDKTLTYAKLKRACEVIESGKPFIVTHPDLYCPTNYGREPDCGAFGKILELVTEKKPLAVLGKPHSLMIEEVVRRSKGRKSDFILVGDRLSTDILMAKNAGIESLLVLSGETSQKILKSSRIKPTMLLRSVNDLLLG